VGAHSKQQKLIEMKRNIDPRLIIAKFDSTCAETGQKIRKGERCVYYPASRSVFSMDSNQAEDYRLWKMDVDWLGQNY